MAQKTIHQKLDGIEKMLKQILIGENKIIMANTELTTGIADVQTAMGGMETRINSEIETLTSNGVSAENLAGLKAIATELGGFQNAPTPVPTPAPAQAKHKQK